MVSVNNGGRLVGRLFGMTEQKNAKTRTYTPVPTNNTLEHTGLLFLCVNRCLCVCIFCRPLAQKSCSNTFIFFFFLATLLFDYNQSTYSWDEKLFHAKRPRCFVRLEIYWHYNFSVPISWWITCICLRYCDDAIFSSRHNTHLFLDMIFLCVSCVHSL